MQEVRLCGHEDLRRRRHDLYLAHKRHLQHLDFDRIADDESNNRHYKRISNVQRGIAK